MSSGGHHPVAEEHFPALDAIAGLRHTFLLRQDGVDVADTDRERILARLAGAHERAAYRLGFAPEQLVRCEQVHGDGVLPVGLPDGGVTLAGADALITAEVGLCLGIYVADCAAVYLVDPVRRALGLVHSGRKGSEGGIAGRAIAAMGERFGSVAADLQVQISPCIRPPAYEVDFVPLILRSCLDAGVPESRVHDAGVCTSSDLGRYYSYRVEKGATGRMLALLGWPPVDGGQGR